jgi:hypothetical protein
MRSAGPTMLGKAPDLAAIDRIMLFGFVTLNKNNSYLSTNE